MALPTITPLSLKKNDRQPYYSAIVKDSDGNPIDLTGATIYCTMKLSGYAKLDRVNAGVVIKNQVTNKGEFEYRWQAGDTDTVGSYEIEFEINPATGGKFTMPNPSQGKAIVEIYDSLDNV